MTGGDDLVAVPGDDSDLDALRDDPAPRNSS
jgi:hypothetical protein